MSIFSDRLYMERVTRRMKRGELASRAGVSVGMIGLYENEGREPAMHNLYALAVALNVSMDYLAGLSDTKERR